MGSNLETVQTIRAPKDIEILKCYLLLVGWKSLWPDGFFEMCNSMREDFGGIGMNCHRVDLMQRLDHVLEELGKGLEYIRKDRPELYEEDSQERKHQRGELRGTSLKVDRKALEILTRRSSRFIVLFDSLNHGTRAESHSTFMCALPIPYSQATLWNTWPLRGPYVGLDACRALVVGLTLALFTASTPSSNYLHEPPRSSMGSGRVVVTTVRSAPERSVYFMTCIVATRSSISSFKF